MADNKPERKHPMCLEMYLMGRKDKRGRQESGFWAEDNPCGWRGLPVTAAERVAVRVDKASGGRGQMRERLRKPSEHRCAFPTRAPELCRRSSAGK